MKYRLLLFVALPLFCFAGSRGSRTEIDSNLHAGSMAARDAVRTHSLTFSHARAEHEARQKAYLLAEADETAARQQILARLLAAKTPEEVDAATVELHDRWLAAKDSMVALKAAAEAEDVAPVAPAAR